MDDNKRLKWNQKIFSDVIQKTNDINYYDRIWSVIKELNHLNLTIKIFLQIIFELSESLNDNILTIEQVEKFSNKIITRKDLDNVGY